MIVTRPRVDHWVSIFVGFFNILFHASADLALSSEDTPLKKVGAKCNRQRDRQIDRQTDRQTDGRTDGRTDRLAVMILMASALLNALALINFE